MCLIFDRKGADQTETITAYKVYHVVDGRLVSPWQLVAYDAGTVVAVVLNNVRLDSIDRWISWCDLGEEHVGKRLHCSGLHCLTSKDDAEYYATCLGYWIATPYNSDYSCARVVVVPVQIEPADVLLQGRTPAMNRELPTVVAGKVTIRQDDFDAAVKCNESPV